jgi:hypothetical protein
MNETGQYLGKKWSREIKIFFGLVTVVLVALIVDSVRHTSAELKTMPPDLLPSRPYLDGYFSMALFQAGLVTLVTSDLLRRWRLFFAIFVAIVFFRWCGAYAYIQMYELNHRGGIGKFLLFDVAIDSLAIFGLLRSRWLTNDNVQASKWHKCLGLGFASYLASIVVVTAIGIAFEPFALPSAPANCKTACSGSVIK